MIESFAIDAALFAVNQYGKMQVEKTFYGRAYGMDIRIDKNEDGSLTAYEAFPFSGMYKFAMRADKETIIRRFDVSGSIRRWLESK